MNLTSEFIKSSTKILYAALDDDTMSGKNGSFLIFMMLVKKLGSKTADNALLIITAEI